MDRKEGRERKIPDFGDGCKYERVMRTLDLFSERYRTIEIGSIGQSILGRSIPAVTLGRGEKKVFYLGGIRGRDSFTAALLLRFLAEYNELLAVGGSAERIPVGLLYETRKIVVLPLLNPDGVEYATCGVSPDNPIAGRLIEKNGSNDFSHWEGNARGVDLSHNFERGFGEYAGKRAAGGIEPIGGYGGEAPESEPEVGALCRYLRFYGDARLALSFECGRSEICPAVASDERNGKILSGLSGCKLLPSEEPAGDFPAWFAGTFDAEAFSVRIGGEEPLFENLPLTYLEMRKLLFGAPLLI